MAGDEDVIAKLDALMGNDISVITQFTFSDAPPSPNRLSNETLFMVFQRKKFNKKANNNFTYIMADCLMQ